MSPCTAKLSAFRSKQVGKYVITCSYHGPNPHHRELTVISYRVKPKSLFAQASAKKLGADGSSNGGTLFASKPAPTAQRDNPFGN